MSTALSDEQIQTASQTSIKIKNKASSSSVANNNQDNEQMIDLHDPDLYFNRELSHLQFNLRVLEQATDLRHPLLERLRFLLIFSSNMDEFYEIRVSGLKKQIEQGREATEPDGKPPQEILKQINETAHAAIERQYEILNDVLLPQLREEKIRFLHREEWNEEQYKWTQRYFRSQVLPVASPLGLDQAHPFPRLVNKSLNFILSLEGKDAFGRDSGLAIVPAPRSLPRLLKLPEELSSEGADEFVFLSSIIHAHVDELFPGMEVKECHQFRVVRNADLDMNTADVEDIASALKGELHSRRFGMAIKLEVAQNCPEALSNYLLQQFHLDEDELFRTKGPVNLQRMLALHDMLEKPELSYQHYVPGIPKALADSSLTFEAISKDDQLLLHPYQSFTPVIDLIRQAAKDPNVLAIKQTLYRTGKTSELVEALAEAARNGKEVTAVIELQARFDEEENIYLANRLQEAGALVSYGVLGHKTHAKMLLIIRKEGRKLKRYVHLGTGNYHPGNAKVYTDYSLLTCDDQIGSDVHRIFQQLTGMGKIQKPQLILNAPFNLKKQLITLIENEIDAAKEGKNARVILKANGLTDPKMIRTLYAASQAGVKVDLIIRGMCRLRPGIEGVSDNIRVISVIGRFLEHTRCYYFENSEPHTYCSSADLMERNLNSRVEVCFPIVKPKLSQRVKKELEKYLSDNTGSWILNSDGSYTQRTKRSNAAKRSVQAEFIDEYAG